MDKTDSKVRLFLELSHPHPIEILSYTPINPYEKWNPAKMYNKPNSQYYYAFINDKELISRVKGVLLPNVHVLEEIEYIKDEIKNPIEFNGYNIEEFQETENTSKANMTASPQNTDFNNENSDVNNQLSNLEEEKYVVFCRFHLKNFGFIHDYNKIQKEDYEKIFETPIIYALKGRIKTLINARFKELESKKGENEATNLHSNINPSEEDKNTQMGMNDMQTMGHKKELEEKNKLLKSNIGIDGHWFLVNNFENIEFLALIKYREVPMNSNEMVDKLNEDHSSIPVAPQTRISSMNTNTINVTNLNNLNISNKIDTYLQPFQFSYYIKESKKFVTVYQNKSCKDHHNKNEFICKKCNLFCCLECFEPDAINNRHYGHKIALLDESLNKFEEDMKFLNERIEYLKSIIDNEIAEKKNEIAVIKNKNAQIVNQINEENEKIRVEIKKEEINRAKVLAFLGNEALRIINDYNLKVKYLKLLNEKGDMNTYLINYFFFEKFYQTEIRKNLVVLERKIILTGKKFKTNNEKLNSVIDDLKKALKINN